MYYASLVIKFLHICAVILMAGGIVARQLVRSRVTRAEEPGAMARAFQLADPIERIMVVPGSMLTLILGVIVALMMGTPIFGFLQGASQNWLLVSNILVVLTFLLVPLVFVPRGKVFAQILEEATRQGRMTTDLRAALDDPVTRAAHAFEIAGVTLVILLMVVKPF